jgi:hypothetical protein
MEVSGQLHASAALPLVPIVLEAEWTPEPVSMLWSREKSLASARNQTLVIQPVACHYIN